ncbi:receptor-like protein 9DC3 [Pistacia vera]|uniref:receptor-like protein 9DC3 n=1 Tax=Pistacia vera TaxID=55513 RepID=UPI001262E985|nr:receptor-like protein 9DC3 [Pistacia vera]
MGCLAWPYQLLFLQLFLFYSHTSAALWSHHQSSALLQFKQLFSFKNDSSEYCIIFADVPSYPKMISWKEDYDCCSWDGVTCDLVTGHVIGLDLSCSWLSGNIPSNISLFLLPQLKRLNLAFKDFNLSPISSNFGRLTSLRHLNLSTSNFGGQIPSKVSHLSKLVSLDLSVVGYVTGNTRHTLMSENGLIIERDVFDRLVQNLTVLTDLALAMLTCLPFPLEFLDVSDMSFSDQSPNSISNLFFLRGLNLRNCTLVGSIPASLGYLTQLGYLLLSYNNLIGEIPDIFVNLRLNGSIPSSIFEIVNLSILDLSSNNLSGIVELHLFSNLKNLGLLDLSYNSLSINTAFKANSSFPQLYDLHLSGCNLTEFPGILRSLNQLQELDLSDNKIRGQIPNWMGDVGMDTLQFLNLSHNNLTGIDQLPWKNLLHLDLRFNLLHGSLPVPPPFLIKNKLYGTIPGKFAKGSPLRTFNINENELEGPIPQSLVNCTMLQVLDIGNNKVNDTFPYWLESLPELQVLVLHSNQFYGSIWGCSKTKHYFPKLKVFDLSNNKFGGPLSARYFENLNAMKDLANLNFLGVPNLSQNQLTGPIPRLPHFDTFGNTSYAGNLGLCGFPLSKECKSDETLQPPSKLEDDVESSIGFGWKAVLMGYGCGMVFGLIMGYLVFSTGKPHWIVSIVEGEHRRKGRRSNKKRGGRRG